MLSMVQISWISLPEVSVQNAMAEMLSSLSLGG